MSHPLLQLNMESYGVECIRNARVVGSNPIPGTISSRSEWSFSRTRTGSPLFRAVHLTADEGYPAPHSRHWNRESRTPTLWMRTPIYAALGQPTAGRTPRADLEGAGSGRGQVRALRPARASAAPAAACTRPADARTRDGPVGVHSTKRVQRYLSRCRPWSMLGKSTR